MPWDALQRRESPGYHTSMVRDTPWGQLTWWQGSHPRHGVVRTRPRLDGEHITVAELERILAELDGPGPFDG